MNFYQNFSYDSNFTFEEYYNQNLINLCTKYNIFIKDTKQFKIFCYSFYYQLIKELKNFDYKKFQLKYKYYNPDAIEEEKLILGNSNEQNPNKDRNSIISSFKNYVNKIGSLNKLNINYESIKKFQKMVYMKMTPLISTTERVVDMVLSVNNKLN